ncbi:unnamed protein product [Adineta steineri]|uniref:Uncharacterized protein n=1 Tax=Adineta steineri TaxID=433720 RepID=A0A816C9F8_9BILA|nr:unnamed protein product [Adineta steineri]CAF1619947.1 unnamed protein product [Adineta steineri]
MNQLYVHYLSWTSILDEPVTSITISQLHDSRYPGVSNLVIKWNRQNVVFSSLATPGIFTTYLETPGRSRHVKLGINLYIDANQNYTSEEKDTNRLTIERFSCCARNVYKSGHEKYLYRPCFIQYLSIHQQLIGLSKEQLLENHITLAHYISMSQPRTMPGCGFNKTVEDTSIRDRFGDRVKTAIAALSILHFYLSRKKSQTTSS